MTKIYRVTVWRMQEHHVTVKAENVSHAEIEAKKITEGRAPQTVNFYDTEIRRIWERDDPSAPPAMN